MAGRKHTPGQVITSSEILRWRWPRGHRRRGRPLDRSHPADLPPVAQRVRGSQDRPGETSEASGVGERPPEESGGRFSAGQPGIQKPRVPRPHPSRNSLSSFPRRREPREAPLHPCHPRLALKPRALVRWPHGHPRAPLGERTEDCWRWTRDCPNAGNRVLRPNATQPVFPTNCPPQPCTTQCDSIGIQLQPLPPAGKLFPMQPIAGSYLYGGRLFQQFFKIARRNSTQLHPAPFALSSVEGPRRPSRSP